MTDFWKCEVVTTTLLFVLACLAGGMLALWGGMAVLGVVL
jgi:hypothetical protein